MSGMFHLWLSVPHGEHRLSYSPTDFVIIYTIYKIYRRQTFKILFDLWRSFG